MLYVTHWYTKYLYSLAENLLQAESDCSQGVANKINKLETLPMAPSTYWIAAAYAGVKNKRK